MTRARYDSSDNTLKEISQMEKPEIWKPILGYEGLYEVSSWGNVKSLQRMVHRDKVGPINVPECILMQEIKVRYLYVSLSKNGNSRAHRAHRLVCAAFHPNPENKPYVNHKNGKKDDNRAENLEWATAKENVNHALYVLGHNRQGLRGEKSWWKKLSDKDIYELAEHIKAGGSFKAFARLKGVAAHTIAGIVKGKYWTHIPIDWKSIYKPNVKYFSRASREKIESGGM